jgi:hypothetical protein
MMRYTSLTTAALLVFISCTGTETDNPLVDFNHSGCKNHGDDTALSASGVASQRHALDVDGGTDDGRYCFAWQVADDGTLRIDVVNYPTACSVDFSSASASLGEGALALSIQRASCVVARCGGCVYDLAFDVRDVDHTRPLALELIERNCEGEPIDGAGKTLTLPIDAEDSGERCF